MKFDTLVFFIIAFNIVMMVLKRRGKKTAEPEEGNGSQQPPTRQGGGLLDQLAVELGLKLPTPEPMPFPRQSAPAAEASIPAPALVTPAVTVALRQESQPVAVIQKRESGGPFSRVASQLRDRHRIQEAWILKEVLEPPVSLRRKR